jgi:SAM-dependent methyltransferase
MLDFNDIIKTEHFAMRYEKDIVTEYCHVCERQRRLYINPNSCSWSNTYTCFGCGTTSRTRAFLMVLDLYFPSYTTGAVYEAGVETRFTNNVSKKCLNYQGSIWDPNIKPGEKIENIASGINLFNQDLENLTYEDNTFDYILTQDVFEHINNPEKAAKEIMRVLKPGGKHIFTVPRISQKPGVIYSRPRIKIENNEIVHLLPPQYHYTNNDPDDSGWLVTYDYGDDFLDVMSNWAENHTSLYVIQELQGAVTLDKTIEVFVTTKAETQNLTINRFGRTIHVSIN